MTRSCSPVLTQMDSDDEHNQPFVIISQPPSPTLSSVSNLSSVESVFSLPEELAPFVSESTTTQLPAPVTITGVDIPGGDLLLQTENTVHRVRWSDLQHHSESFDTVESTHNGIVSLNGVATKDLMRLLSLLYPNDLDPFLPTSKDDWLSVLHLAHQLDFLSIRELAIKNLTPLLSAIDKIIFGHEHDIPTWLLEPYTVICQREEPPSLEEGERLGMRAVIAVVHARHELKSRFVTPQEIKYTVWRTCCPEIDVPELSQMHELRTQRAIQAPTDLVASATILEERYRAELQEKKAAVEAAESRLREAEKLKATAEREREEEKKARAESMRRRIAEFRAKRESQHKRGMTDRLQEQKREVNEAAYRKWRERSATDRISWTRSQATGQTLGGATRSPLRNLIQSAPTARDRRHIDEATRQREQQAARQRLLDARCTYYSRRDPSSRLAPLTSEQSSQLSHARTAVFSAKKEEFTAAKTVRAYQEAIKNGTDANMEAVEEIREAHRAKSKGSKCKELKSGEVANALRSRAVRAERGYYSALDSFMNLSVSMQVEAQNMATLQTMADDALYDDNSMLPYEAESTTPRVRSPELPPDDAEIDTKNIHVANDCDITTRAIENDATGIDLPECDTGDL